MNDIIEKTKVLLKSDEKYSVGEISKIWPMTNENLKEIYELFDVKDKSVLTVTSSGDHIFEAIIAGAKVIDSFDINYLTKFHYYLKKTMIQRYKLTLYLDIIEDLSYGVISTKHYNKIRNKLNDECQFFWDEIINYSQDINDINLKNLFNTTISPNHFDLVSYLSKINYKKLQSKLDNFDADFIHSDLFSLDTKLNKTYDLIYLSNICGYTDKYSYFGLKKTKEYSLYKLYPYLNDGGTIVYGYLYGYSLEHFKNLYIKRDNNEILYSIMGKAGKKDCLLTLKK